MNDAGKHGLNRSLHQTQGSPMKASLLFVGASAVLLSACGGGGGGEDNSAKPSAVVASTSSFPVAAAISAMDQTAESYTLSTVNANGKTYTLTITTAPGAQAVFEKRVASTLVQTVVVRQNGTLTNQLVSTAYFQPTPYLNFGDVNQSTGEYSVADVSTPLYLPDSAKVGASGAINSAVTYSNSSKTTVVSRETRTWSLEADSATTANLCANIVSTPVSGTIYSEVHCARITTSGVVSGHTVTINEDGQSLTFK
jgi:hypothetical protein